MNKDELIASGILETYVLGLCSAEETALVNALCLKHPELISEIEAIEESLILAASAQVEKPKASIKENLLSRLQFEEPEKESRSAQIIELPKQTRNTLNLYRFGMAASLVLFVTSLTYNFLLNHKLNALHSELAELNASKSVMADQMHIQQTKLNALDQHLQIIADPHVHTIQLAGMNSLDKHFALIRWNKESKTVFFEAQDLPLAPEGKQYQLWAIVKGLPVDAGTLSIQAGDSIFQKMKNIPEAEAFALTIEKAGGSASPSLETMCLLGKI